MNTFSKKLIWLVIVLMAVVWFSPFWVQAETTRIVPKNAVNLEVGIGGFNQVKGGIVDYIGQIYIFATAIVGGLAVVMIIIGAVQYSSSAGNKAAMGSAKETITSAIIGLVIVLMAYLILGTFSGDFVNLVNPRLEVLDISDQAPGKAGCSWQTGTSCSDPVNFRQGDAVECGGTAEAGKVCCCQRVDTLPGTCFDFSADKNSCDPDNGKRNCFKPISGPYNSLTGCTVNCTNKNPANFCKESPVADGQQSSAYCCYEDVTPPPSGVPECPADTTTGRMYDYYDQCKRACGVAGDKCCRAADLTTCVAASSSDKNWCCMLNP